VIASVAAGPGTTQQTDPPLSLSLGETGAAMASCMPVSSRILADMPIAFRATATAVDGETVTLSVGEWFSGDSGNSVVLAAPPGLEALIGGIDFRRGDDYLVTATGGVVNYCGYSGEATPELEAVFAEAFGN
jgi:hypothetical protein